jgi:RNA polymerase sigma factor (sigma-70 family)
MAVMRHLGQAGDHALVLATARGDEAAFAAFVARHRARLVRYATGRCGGDGALGEDAVQDALVRAHRAILAGKVPQDPVAWLFAIVRNRCHDFRRAAQATSELPHELPLRAPSAAEVVERGERFAHALDVVGRLPDAQRAALVGRELEGRTYEELAARQATTVSAIKSLLHRARTTLAHHASLPALATPLLARLARLRPGAALGAIAEQTTGAVAVAAVVAAGTTALASLSAPPPAPTTAQARAALVATAPKPHPSAGSRCASVDAASALRDMRATRDADPEYGGCRAEVGRRALSALARRGLRARRPR